MATTLQFTLEFFQLIEARLAEGSVVATMRGVFPELAGFHATEGDWPIAASRGAPI